LVDDLSVISRSAFDRLESISSISFFESLNDPVIVFGTEGIIIYANKSLETKLGISNASVIGSHFLEIPLHSYNSSNDTEIAKKRLEEVLLSESPVSYDYNILTKQGKEFSFRSNLIKISDVKDDTEYIVALMEDITKRQETEAKLQDITKSQDLSYEKAAIGMVWSETNGNFIRVNKAFCELTGYTEDELLDYTFHDITYPGDYNISADAILKLINGETSSEVFEKRYVHKSGRIIDVKVSTAFIPNELSGKGYLFEQVEDITVRKQMMDALRASEGSLFRKGRISKIFLTVPDDEMYNEILGIILEETKSEYGVFGYLDEDGSLVVPSMSEAIWEAANFTGKRVVFKRDSWGTSSWTRAILEKKTIVLNEPTELTPMGGVPIERHISVPLIHHDRVVGLFQIANGDYDYNDRDVAILEHIAKKVTPILAARLQRDRNEAALQQLNDELEDRVEERTLNLHEAQEQLIRNERLATLGKISGSVGHELRNPLASIKNASYFLNLVLESPSPDVKDTLDILSKEITNCEEIITSLLDYARPNTPTFQKVTIPDIIESAVSSLEIPTSIKIDLRLDDNLKFFIGDKNQLKRVFINLISNAIQAMPKGGLLTISTLTTEDATIRITVADTGVGIPEDKMIHLFEPLYTTKVTGIGLGLVVVKSLIEGHEGTIEVKSKEQEGTQFIMTLPIRTGEV